MVFTISRKTFNDVHLGLCFTILYASTNSITHIQQMFFKSIHHDDPHYNVNGYVSLGITYVCMSVATFIAPSLITMIGWKPTLLMGAITYNYFVLYYFERNWVTYLGTVLNGFGAGFLWLSEATYMILNSEIKSTTQSVGIFWTFYQSSYVIGNAVVYFVFNNNEDPYLSQSMRLEIIVIFASIVMGAFVMFSLLRNPIRQKQVDELRLTPLDEIKNVFRTINSRETLFDNIIYIYVGMNYSFLSVIASSLGFTEYLSNNSKIYAPLSGVLQGAGEIVGVLFTAWLDRRSILKLRAIPIACIVSMVAYIMVFLALPSTSAFTYTDQKPIIELSIYILMIGNGLVGFSDACFHTGMYNYVGYIHPKKCAPALAHLKFTRNVASAVAYYYSSYLDLQIQTVILMFGSVLAFCTFYGTWNKTYSSEAEEEKS